MGTFIAPAFGADKIITSANTCTVDVLGVYENDATANTIATWDLIDYTLAPGEYLNVTDTSVTETTCPAGSYCVGGGYTVETADNSIAQCPTGYPNSDAGAGAQNQCYTACTVATANIAHATAVGGNDYFGDGADACYATACDKGYHINGEITLVEQTPLIPLDYIKYSNGNYTYIAPDGSNFGADLSSELSGPGTYAVGFADGVVYGKASCQATTDPAIEYAMNNLEAVTNGSKTMEELRQELRNQYGQAKANVIMDYFEHFMSGSTDGLTNEANFETFAKYFVTFSESSDKNYSTSSAGQYCYCQMDGYQAAGGAKEMVTSAPWVFNSDFGSADSCASECSEYCVYSLRLGIVHYRAFRAVMYGALGVSQGGVCEANTINIDWNPDNGGDHIKNMCTYDGVVTLPTPDPVKPGYTFTGWKLVE